MIELKNVSKFYYSKGMITSGFSRVNLTLDVGEFVVITGESGSGKSTLLNVISGLDSYEEGEMYIEGKETSHYLAADFEEYRKKYIGNIFQNFNSEDIKSLHLFLRLHLILYYLFSFTDHYFYFVDNPKAFNPFLNNEFLNIPLVHFTELSRK